MNSQKKFSLVEALRFAFTTFLDNIVFFIGLTFSYWAFVGCAFLLCFLISAFFSNHLFPSLGGFSNIITNLQTSFFLDSHYFPHLLKTANPFIIVSGVLIFWLILNAFFTLGLIKCSLEFYDTGKSSFKTFFSCKNLIARSVLATFLYLFASLLGFLCFVIPGIYIFVTYSFFNYSFAYHNTSISEAFKESARITQNAKLDLCALLVIFAILGKLSLYLLIPFSILVYTHVYRTLLKENQGINSREEIRHV